MDVGAPRCAAELLALSRLSGGTSRRDVYASLDGSVLRSGEFEVMAGRRASPRLEKIRDWKTYRCAGRPLRACRYRRARLAASRVLSRRKGESRSCSINSTLWNAQTTLA